METLHINVDSAHIESGIRMCSLHCPIGLAISEQHEHVDLVAVGYGKVRIKKGPRYYNYQLPETARNFVKQFDKREKVNPIRFDIEIVQPKKSASILQTTKVWYE